MNMIKEFVLIIIVATSSGSNQSGTSLMPGFSSEENCRKAGAQIVSMFKHLGNDTTSAKFSCVEINR